MTGCWLFLGGAMVGLLLVALLNWLVARYRPT
jgi:hypothetical protein